MKKHHVPSAGHVTLKSLAAIAGAALCILGVVSVSQGREGAAAGKVGTWMPGAFAYQGNATCTACHAGGEKKGGSNKSADQCDTWEKSDPHHESFESLSNDASKGIAGKLKIAKASESDRCLSCHAVNAPTERRGPKFSIDEGNSCESCHGPAEKWNQPHATEGWTAGERAKADPAALMNTWGLFDTTNYATRAAMCINCHLNIEKDLVDAGHPALKFEMAGYNNYNYSDKHLPHWEEAKGKANGARLWAVGQAAALPAAKHGGASMEGLAKIYEAGVGIAKKNFGADTAEALNKAAYDGAKCKAAAGELAALAGNAKSKEERFVIASGVSELVSATFDAAGAAVPDSVNDAIGKAMDAKEADFAAAVKALAGMAK